MDKTDSGETAFFTKSVRNCSQYLLVGVSFNENNPVIHKGFIYLTPSIKQPRMVSDAMKG